MNIILIIIILIIILISYLIYNNKNKNIEHITNTLNNNDLENVSSLNKFVIPYEPDNLSCTINEIEYPKKLNYNNNIYKINGKALNKLYNQEYYLYESKVDQCGDLLMRNNLEYLKDQLYNYIFVYYVNNKIKIKYNFGPRNKINNGDIIYLDIKKFNNGISYIGPYIIK